MASLGTDGSRIPVLSFEVDTASNVAAGTAGSCFISAVTVVGKDAVSVNKEIPAVGGVPATDVAVKVGARSSLADSEYSVTP